MVEFFTGNYKEEPSGMTDHDDYSNDSDEFDEQLITRF